MFGLEDLFDFDHNGKMDALENAAMHTSLYDLTNDTRKRRKPSPWGNDLSSEINIDCDDNDWNEEDC